MNFTDMMGDWVEQGLCAQTGADDEVWFPDKGHNPIQAKALCGRCPVIDECLKWALENREQGVWGGTTEHERRDLRGGRPPKRPHLCFKCGRSFTTPTALSNHERSHQTVCRNGHDLTLPNAVGVYMNGQRRECRQCEADRKARYRANKVA